MAQSDTSSEPSESADACTGRLRAPVAIVAGRRLEARTVLTVHELRVCALAAHGLTNSEIADRVVVSATTAKWHLDRAREKVGARNRVELAAWMWQTGLVEPYAPDDWSASR